MANQNCFRQYVGLLVLGFLLVGCGQISSDSATVSETAPVATSSNPFVNVTPEQHHIPSVVPTPLATATPAASATPTPTSSATPTSTPIATATPIPSATATPPALPQVNGWTTFTAQPGARMIYVSAAGDDANPGTEVSPRRTFEGGYALLRDGQADWLHLRRGDTFTLPGLFQWSKSGPAAQPGWMRLTAYGAANLPRPRIDSPPANDAFHITPGFQSNRRITNLAWTDVHLVNSARLANPAAAGNSIAVSTVAVQWQGTGFPFSNLLFENVHFNGFSFALNSSGDVENLTLRRNFFHYIFSVTGHSSGVLAAPSGLLLEDNLFYLIQSADIPGLGSNADSMFTHAAYIGAGATQVVNRGNIVIKASDGMMQRAGGIYERNFTAHCNVGGLMGQAWGVVPTPGGVQTNLSDNVILNARGLSYIVGNTAAGNISNNLFIRDQNGTIPFGLDLVGRNDTGSGVNVGVHNTIFSGNVLSNQISWNPGDTISFSGLSFMNNQQNIGTVNTSMSAYLAQATISGTSIDDWANFLLTRDRDNFTVLHTSTSAINFYRSQVGMAALP